MRFMILRRIGREEAAREPDAAWWDAMARYYQTLTDVGVLRAGEMMHPNAIGALVSFSAPGRSTVAESAFTAGTRLAGFCLIDVAGMDEAVAWAKRWPIPDDADEVVLEVRPIGCAAGLLGFTAPLDAAAERRRFVVLLKSDEILDADADPGAAVLSRMAQRNDESRRDGFLLSGDGLGGSARSKRVTLRSGRASVTDGPFAEVKELVAGYWLVEGDAIDDVVAWVQRYPYPVERAQVEIREVFVPAHALSA